MGTKKRIDVKLKKIIEALDHKKVVNGKITLNWKPDDFKCILFITKEKGKYFIALDVYGLHDNVFMEDFGISVEGHKTWKETKQIFLSIAKDNFWRDYEKEQEKE